MHLPEQSSLDDQAIDGPPLIVVSDRSYVRNLIAAVIVGLLGAIILGLATEYTLVNLNQSRAAARASRNSMLALSSYLKVVSDAENSQRGYLLSGNSELLKTYKADAASYTHQYQLTASLLNPQAKSSFDDLKARCDQKMAALQSILSINQSGGFDAARNAIRADSVKNPASVIALLGANLQTTEQTRFDALVAQVNALNGSVFTLVAVLIVFELLVIGIVIWIILKQHSPETQLPDDQDLPDEVIRSKWDTLQLANAQLEATLKRFENLFRGMPVSCYFAGPDGEILEWNSASEVLFGYSNSEATKRTIYDTIVPPDGFAKAQSYYDGVMSGQAFEDIEWVCRTRDGRELEVMSNLLPLVGDNGDPIGVIAATINMTDRKAVDRLKSEFVSTVSHELRTPLTSIRGALALVCSGAMGQMSDQAKKLCTIANSNTERLVRLINDLLDIEKIETGGIAFRSVSFSLDEFTVNALSAMKGYAEEYKVTLDCEIDVGKAMVNSDPDRLMQVFNNVVSNAIKFSGEGKRVVVRASLTRTTARFAVQDRGPGISDEFRSRIFTKFAQADSADTRKVGGTGLGLSISKAIMEKLHGRIWFETGNLGTTFYFEIPMARGLDGSGPVTKPSKALICDGDKNFVNTLLILLSHTGIQTHVSYTAVHAKQLLGQERYDVLILDLHLPDQDGLEFLKEVRQHPDTENLPVVIVAGSKQHELKSINGDAIVDWISRTPLDSARLVDSVMEGVSLSKRQGA